MFKSLKGKFSGAFAGRSRKAPAVAPPEDTSTNPRTSWGSWMRTQYKGTYGFLYRSTLKVDNIAAFAIVGLGVVALYAYGQLWSFARAALPGMLVGIPVVLVLLLLNGVAHWLLERGKEMKTTFGLLLLYLVMSVMLAIPAAIWILRPNWFLGVIVDAMLFLTIPSAAEAVARDELIAAKVNEEVKDILEQDAANRQIIGVAATMLHVDAPKLHSSLQKLMTATNKVGAAAVILASGVHTMDEDVEQKAKAHGARTVEASGIFESFAASHGQLQAAAPPPSAAIPPQAMPIPMQPAASPGLQYDDDDIEGLLDYDDVGTGGSPLG